MRGRWKVTDVRALRFTVVFAEPARAAFFALFAFATGASFPSFFALSALSSVFASGGVVRKLAENVLK